MSDDEPINVDDRNPIDVIREEFQAELKAMKEAFDASNKEKDALIAQLKESNNYLTRSVVRNTKSDPEVVHEPTEEELYDAKVKDLSSRVLDYMKMRS